MILSLNYLKYIPTFIIYFIHNIIVDLFNDCMEYKYLLKLIIKSKTQTNIYIILCLKIYF